MANDEVEIDQLMFMRFFKALSLLVAQRAGLEIPSTLLMSTLDKDVLLAVGEKWGWPLMLRMDYSRIPKQKPVGGVAVPNLSVATRACNSLFAIGCVPVFHPNIDRLRNRRSVAVMWEPVAPDRVLIEVVGPGFDAGDLRMGRANPHEFASAELRNGSFERISLITCDLYRIQRAERIKYVDALSGYSAYVARNGRLVHGIVGRTELDGCDTSSEDMVPSEYEPMGRGQYREILAIARVLVNSVIEMLPSSKDYVATIIQADTGLWYLLDIFGHWYYR